MPPTAACSREKTASEWPWVTGVQAWGKGSPGPNAEYHGEGISPEVVIVQMKGGGRGSITASGETFLLALGFKHLQGDKLAPLTVLLHPLVLAGSF